ncbi:hypothetical protein K4K58_009162 [Colletotrichum sp. SAR11_239]|nr:hypothetical protein K4K58_009162 [Colletotrichum sp. SAR11_239]
MAASFASLALKCSDGNLMKQARMHYAKALCQTNKCLSSTDLAVQDSTLAAVLLLGLFEAIVFTGQQSLDSWNAHTVGAVELLRLRGPKQLETPLGRTLFLHSSGNIRTSCAHTKRAVPPRLLQLFESAKPMLDLSDPFLMTAPIVDRVASLRSRIERVHDQNRRDLVWEALDLDIETLRLGQGVAEDWKFTARLPGQSSRLTYKGISLRYPSLRALRYWNALRIIRMFLNDLVWVQSSKILQQGPDLDDETDYEELQTSAKRNMSTLVVEVLASCGEYLEPAEERFSVSARCLIWPLSVIAEVSITPPDARQFATDCLERLGRDCRIPKAADMTTSLLSIQGADCPPLSAAADGCCASADDVLLEPSLEVCVACPLLEAPAPLLAVVFKDVRSLVRVAGALNALAACPLAVAQYESYRSSMLVRSIDQFSTLLHPLLTHDEMYEVAELPSPVLQ